MLCLFSHTFFFFNCIVKLYLQVQFSLLSKMLVQEGPAVWHSLKGLICIYKPSEVSVRKLRETLIHKICQGMNQLETRPPSKYVSIEGNPSEKLSVGVKPNFADHTLVVGPRYQEQDLQVSWSNYLGYYTSGVLLFGIRSGTKQAKFIRENRPTRAYRIKGVLGQATDNCFKTGKVVMRSTWRHVKQAHMDRFLSAMQASHQKKMFELCGVDLQSQTAFDLAVQGLIRPADSKIPVIYGIKCVEFNPPEFTLEIQCVNEYEDYLMYLTHEIGEKLHSTAHCTGLQCIRHSQFTLEHAMLMKHWTLPNILENMNVCSSIIKKSGGLQPQKSAHLI